MQRFKNILLALAPEVDATTTLDKTIELATANKADLTLVSVVEMNPERYHRYEREQGEILRGIMVQRQAWLEQQMQTAAKQGINTSIDIMVGAPFLEIVRRVLRHKHDLVIITGSKKTGLHTRLFRTTSMHLMRKCPCPVWVMHQDSNQGYKNILAAVDPMFIDPLHDSLDPLILALANSLAQKDNAQLHIAHAWHLFAESYIRNFTSMSPEELREAKAQERELHEERLAIVLYEAGLEQQQPKVHLIEGDPATHIIRLINEQHIDLLIMGTICRTGISGYLIGNTAEKVLDKADCAVLTVKPEGFKSTVTLEEVAQ